MSDAVTLQEIMLEEKKVLEEILALEKTTQEVLILGDAPKLEELTREKGRLLTLMHELETKRQQREQEHLSLPGWSALRRELMGILAALERVQKINNRLLLHNLRSIHQITAAFYPAAETFYAAKGGKGNSPSFPAGILDSSV